MGDVSDTPVSVNTGLPLLPLRDVVVYPQIVQPLFVGRPRSIRSLEVAMHSHKQVLLVAQKNASDDDPGIKDIYSVGTIATIFATDQIARWHGQGARGRCDTCTHSQRRAG